jgi:uncharacterized protein
MDAESTATPPVMDTNARLSVNDSFQFACGPHVPCFTECCAKLELLLTPYDALQLKRKLGMTSAQFLDEHAIIRFRTVHGFPEVLLKMDPENENRCPFVTPQGCSLYEDRPAACRIYPLGRASSTHPVDGSRREFYFTVKESHCRGFEQTKHWKVREWIADQGLEEYNRLNDLLMELYVLRARSKSVELTPQHLQMFVMACYNGERFREFVFRSGFLQKIDIPGDVVSALERDDVALLEFAFQWLRFALFHEPVLTLRASGTR